MIEVTKMWLMCRIFKRNESSWHIDSVTEILNLSALEISTGDGKYRKLTEKERGNLILGEISKAKDSGVFRSGIIGAYLHRYRPWRRYKNWKHLKGDLLNYDGENSRHQKVFSNARITLKNCIDDNLIKPDENNSNAVYLTGKGRKFARISYPFKVFFSWYPVKTAVGWGIPLLLIYIFSRYLNINIQSK